MVGGLAVNNKKPSNNDYYHKSKRLFPWIVNLTSLSEMTLKYLNECMCFEVPQTHFLGFLNIVVSNPAARCKKKKEEKSQNSKALWFHRILTFLPVIVDFQLSFHCLVTVQPLLVPSPVALVAFGVKICYCRSHDLFTTICLESCTLPQNPNPVRSMHTRL